MQIGGLALRGGRQRPLRGPGQQGKGGRGREEREKKERKEEGKGKGRYAWWGTKCLGQKWASQRLAHTGPLECPGLSSQDANAQKKDE